MNHVNIIGQVSSEKKYNEDNTEITFHVVTSTSTVDYDGNSTSANQEHHIILKGRLANTTTKFLDKDIAIEGSLIYISGKAFIVANDYILL